MKRENEGGKRKEERGRRDPEWDNWCRWGPIAKSPLS
jgi:hypothetical protein